MRLVILYKYKFSRSFTICKRSIYEDYFTINYWSTRLDTKCIAFLLSKLESSQCAWHRARFRPCLCFVVIRQKRWGRGTGTAGAWSGSPGRPRRGHSLPPGWRIQEALRTGGGSGRGRWPQLDSTGGGPCACGQAGGAWCTGDAGDSGERAAVLRRARRAQTLVSGAAGGLARCSGPGCPAERAGGGSSPWKKTSQYWEQQNLLKSCLM